MLWIFNGSNSRFCSGVFSSKENAERWICHYELSGLLTLYPIDESAYDWAIKNNLFSPSKENERSAEFIQKFTSSSQEHYHYENGKLQ